MGRWGSLEEVTDGQVQVGMKIKRKTVIPGKSHRASAEATSGVSVGSPGG